MKTLPLPVIAEKNKLEGDSPFVILTELRSPDGSIVLRLALANDDVDWGGFTWVSFPMQFSGGPGSEATNGELVSITIKVANVERTLEPYIEPYDGLVDWDVIIRVINTAFIDDPDPFIPPQYLKVLEVSTDARWASFRVGAENLFRRRVPQSRLLQNACRFEYGDSRCGHTGASCDGSLANCRTNGNSDRFGGCPGLGTGAFTQ